MYKYINILHVLTTSNDLFVLINAINCVIPKDAVIKFNHLIINSS